MYKPKVDEEGRVVLKEGMPVWVDDEGKDVALDVNDLSSRVLAANSESKKRKERIRELEERMRPLEGIDDIDAYIASATAAHETIKNLEEKDVRKAETVEKIKGEMRQGFAEKEEKLKAEYQKALDDLQKAVDAKDGQIRQLMVSNKFAACELFAGPDPRTMIPPDMAERYFGDHFKVEEHDGKVRLVAYANGEPIYSRERVGEYADFDEAMAAIFSRYPAKDRVMRASGGGTGATPGTGTAPAGKQDLASLIKQRNESQNPAERIALQRQIHAMQLKQLTGT